jgi:hypothetical protein
MVISLIIAAQNQRKMSDAMDNKDNKDVITQSNSSKSRANECIELKNLKYKSMMLKNNQKKGDAAMQLLHNTSKTDSVINVEKFLEHERSNKTNDLWGKLDKTVKISKLNAFAKKYVEDNGLNNSDISSLVSFLTTCIDHKKIVKTKDVVYDKTNGVIVSIPILTHITNTNVPIKFTLRRCEKRPSTLKSLHHGNSKVLDPTLL